ncbi:MAG: hypothetical protein A3F46_01810 [Legionellales bacterium RIFCSPHIGHO2_12_FULL_42_9]|nr:MAG: hypothetical protein A3F46_01810 [Legionellales bacterium RIFCSPHIGHO2_12_FULL_42_9]
MNTTTKGLGLLILITSTYSWAAGPCLPIAEACMKEGYYQGGEKTGKGLIKDCILPMTSKQKSIENTTFSDDVLQACQATIITKMDSMKKS